LRGFILSSWSSTFPDFRELAMQALTAVMNIPAFNDISEELADKISANLDSMDNIVQWDSNCRVAATLLTVKPALIELFQQCVHSTSVSLQLLSGRDFGPKFIVLKHFPLLFQIRPNIFSDDDYATILKLAEPRIPQKQFASIASPLSGRFC
jgi:hypothetical protein